jgi:hypothetical protein
LETLKVGGANPMSADLKMKTEPQNEAAPAEQNEYARRLTAQLKEMMEGFLKDCNVDVNITAKDRQRLNGAKELNLSFIKEAFKIANGNPGLMPKFLNVSLLSGKLQELQDLNLLIKIMGQFALVAGNAFIIKSDDCYNNALAIYDCLKRESNRAITDGADDLFNKLRPFFKSRGKKTSKEKSSQLV